MTISKESWMESLEKCLEFFINEEEYEDCEKIKKLQNIIKNENI